MTDDENKVIEAARQGFVIGMMDFSPGIEKLLRAVYRAGYKQSQIDYMEKRLKEMQDQSANG